MSFTCCCPIPLVSESTPCCAAKAMTPPKPDLGHRYLWAVLAGPIVVVIAALATAWIAWSGADKVLPTYDVSQGASPADIRTPRAKP